MAGKNKGGRPVGTAHPFRRGPKLPGDQTKKEKAAEPRREKKPLRKKPGE